MPPTTACQIGSDPAEIGVPETAGGFVTVDLAALVENWRIVGRMVGPGCAVAAVVKADAYGLGMAPVARALARAGCRWFFVATAEEATALAGEFGAEFPGIRIAVLAGPSPALTAFPGLVPVLNDLGQIAAWRAMAPGRPAMLHLDTGMARLGMPPAEALRLAEQPALLDGLPVAAVLSHLACAEERGHPMNERQRTEFLRLAGRLPAAPRSISASFGAFLGRPFHLDMVRIGAALYGINPLPGEANPMRRVVGLKGRILQVRDVAAGDTVGYGATWTAERPRRIATLGLGYADGVLRAAGNSARCRIGPAEAPIVGRISMDLLTVDVTGVPAQWVHPDALVDLIGPHGTIEEIAGDSGTLGYEFLSRLGPRLPRLYSGAA